MAMKSSSSDRPVTTSGITSGMLASALSRSRNRKLPSRTKASAISTPKTVDSVAAFTATQSDLPSASSTASFSRSSPYHLVEKPAQTDTRRLLLKL